MAWVEWFSTGNDYGQVLTKVEGEEEEEPVRDGVEVLERGEGLAMTECVFMQCTECRAGGVRRGGCGF